MLFDEKTTMFKIISVLELNWEASRGLAAPRSFHALSLRLKGHADFKFSDRSLHIDAGDVLYIPAGVGYEISHSDEHLIVIHFETDNDAALQRVFSFTPRSKQIYKELFEEILISWNRIYTGTNFAALSVFGNILDKIHKEALNYSPMLSNGNLKDVFEYIHENYRVPDINISGLADIYGTSETYFRKVFKEAVGCSPLKYIISLRLKYAKELLISGYYSVKAVSEKVGFSDQKYFSRLFKQFTGISPSDFSKL